MKTKRLVPLFLMILMLSCFSSDTEGTNLSQYGFYSSNQEILDAFRTHKLTYRHHFMLGNVYKNLKSYKKAILHYANSCFLYEQNLSMKIYPIVIYNFADGYHLKSEYYNDALFEIASLFFLYQEYDYVIKFIDLMKQDKTALYRDASLLKSRALIEMKKYDVAAQTLEKALPLFSDPQSQCLMHIRRASAYMRIPDHQKALSSYIRVIMINNRGWQAKIAVDQIGDLMKKSGLVLSDIQKFHYATAAYHCRYYLKAAQFLKELKPEKLKDSQRKKAAYYQLRTYLRLNRMKEANQIVESFKPSKDYFEALKIRADEYWSMKNWSLALQDYKTLSSQGLDTISKESLKRIASYYGKRKLIGFENHLLQFIRTYPDDIASENFYWLLGQNYLKRKNYNEAENLFKSSLKSFPGGKYSDRMRFWLHKIYLSRKNSDDAIAQVQEMIYFNPESNYTWILLSNLARTINANDAYRKYLYFLDRKDKMATALYHSLLLLLEKDIGKRTERAGDLKLLDARKYREFEKSIESLDLQSPFADQLKGLEKYFCIGYLNGINRELAVLPEDSKVQRDKSIAIAKFGYDYQNYYLSVLSTIELFKFSDVKNNFSLLPEKTLERLFPRAFEKCIRESSRKFKISIPLLYAVIKAESLYNTDVVSPAGAVGLMQLMPATARGIARELKVKSFDLKKPCTSITFGAHYLAWLSKYFNGNVELIMAGYNAGPGNAQKWKDSLNTDDLDIFTELLPFEETRYYILRTKKFVIQGAILYR